MNILSCQRCGELFHRDELFHLVIEFDNENIYSGYICEQCYQTIKEVLEDETIK